MARSIGRLVGTAAFLAAAAPLLGTPGGGRSPLHAAADGRIVPPLADPALVPGVARCTSDLVCTVTDALGSRPGTPLALVP